MALGLKDAIFGALQAGAGVGAIAATGGAAAPLVLAGGAKTISDDVKKADAPPPVTGAPPPPPPPMPPPQMTSPGIAGGAAPGAAGMMSPGIAGPAAGPGPMPPMGGPLRPPIAMSDERRKTAVQSGTEDIKRFLSHFSDNALTPPAPVRSDARAKDEAYAMGQRHGEMAATARWARFAPDVPHSAIGPSKITNKAGLVVPSNELSEARHGLAFQGGAPMHIQAPQGAGAPLPAPAVATYPGHGAEAQTRASGMPADWAPWLDAGPPMQDPNIPAQVMPPVLPDDELRRQAALQGQPVASDRQLKAYVKPADRSIKDFLTQVYAHARV